MTAKEETNPNEKMIVIGDLIIKSSHYGKNQIVNVYESDSGKKYKIDGNTINNVEFIPNFDIVVFKTKSSVYFRDYNNIPISNSEYWSDYFYEDHTRSFYRKDPRGFWYDIEGFRIKSSIVLKNDVLCSLNGKVSKKNMMFANADLYVSPNEKMVQIGKVVLDYNLEFLYYFNDKVTSLGNMSIHFEDDVVYQNVKIGLLDSVFINEQTLEPVTCNGLALVSYYQTVTLGSSEYHIFSSTESTHFINTKTQEPLELVDGPHDIDHETYMLINGEEIISIKTKKENYYINISTKSPYYFPNYPNSKVRKVSKSFTNIQNKELINIQSDDAKFVVNSTNGEIYVLKDNRTPEKIKNLPGFENTLALITLQGKQVLFSLIEEDIVYLGEQKLTIQSIDGDLNNKLINATDSANKKVVLDIRSGFDNMTLAKSGNQLITEMIDRPYNIGSKILQNAKMATLGGEQNRVINLNAQNLNEFCIPTNLKEYHEGEEGSVFRGAPLLSLDFDNPITIGAQTFLSGQFRSYDDELHSVIIQNINGKPLHLEGFGHKNELVTGFNQYTLKDKFFLGPHRMIGVSTLKEDLKSNELIFSLDLMSSWIPFYDTHLPIFKRIVELKDRADWEYNLFELREISNDKEYIAIEKNTPHRILVHKKGGKKRPKVVKSQEKILKSPEEISMIKKLFFEDPGVLVEVY